MADPHFCLRANVLLNAKAFL